ncbi:Retrovirus-related Pol polyprotein from transposon [Dictyocoela roeselum]|nr:Retrovirus-related Pol polyprotein from transposon [Dictyocoela roeselum]
MPFGLCNAPATFQRVMNEMFKNKNDVLIYLDDILIYSSSPEKHYESLKGVFEILNQNYVSVNFEKSKFAMEKIDFLGHHISSSGIQPNITKISEYTLKIPKTKKQLQKILGLLNWYRPFVPSISMKLSNLYSLLKNKSKTITWTRHHTETFNNIVKQIKQKQTLHYPDLNRPFIPKTNASEKK